MFGYEPPKVMEFLREHDLDIKDDRDQSFLILC